MDRFERFHRYFFTWHCRNFFNFRRAVTPGEWAYLETCFKLAKTEEAHDWGDGPHFSYYTYSHRVKGEQCNSTRLAYGTVAHAQQLAALARPLVEARAVPLEPVFWQTPGCHFYMLGWDFAAEQFKVYFRLDDIERLPLPRLRDLLVKSAAARHPQGLVSFSFVGTEPVEEKVYVYPTEGELPEGAYAQAHMITDQRGVVPQYDVSGNWADRVNPVGQDLLDRYVAMGQPLDTIAYHDYDDFTLYFPPRQPAGRQ